jgi:hypothetical protein
MHFIVRGSASKKFGSDFPTPCDLDLDVCFDDEIVGAGNPFCDPHDDLILPHDGESFINRVQAIAADVEERIGQNDSLVQGVTFNGTVAEVTRSLKLRVTVADHAPVEVDVFPKRLNNQRELVSFGPAFGDAQWRGAKYDEFSDELTQVPQIWLRRQDLDNISAAILIVKHYAKLQNLGIKSYHIAVLASYLTVIDGADVRDYIQKLWPMVVFAALTGGLWFNGERRGVRDYSQNPHNVNAGNVGFLMTRFEHLGP